MPAPVFSLSTRLSFPVSSVFFFFAPCLNVAMPKAQSLYLFLVPSVFTPLGISPSSMAWNTMSVFPNSYLLQRLPFKIQTQIHVSSCLPDLSIWVYSRHLKLNYIPNWVLGIFPQTNSSSVLAIINNNNSIISLSTPKLSIKNNPVGAAFKIYSRSCYFIWPPYHHPGPKHQYFLNYCKILLIEFPVSTLASLHSNASFLNSEPVKT